jgi:hypothetical protein
MLPVIPMRPIEQKTEPQLEAQPVPIAVISDGAPVIPNEPPATGS